MGFLWIISLPYQSETKVIPFSEGYFKRRKYLPLTSKMIVSLLAAIDLQDKNTTFGPTSIQGSLVTLIERGLIVIKKITFRGHEKYQWQVTQEAIFKIKRIRD